MNHIYNAGICKSNLHSALMTQKVNNKRVNAGSALLSVLIKP